MKNNLTAASIRTLVDAKGPYRLQVSGTALHDAGIKHGELVTIRPAVNAAPANLATGCVLLVAVASNPKTPEFLDFPTLCTLNADHSISVGTTQVQQFAILGTVQLPQRQTASDAVLYDDAQDGRPPHDAPRYRPESVAYMFDYLTQQQRRGAGIIRH